MKIRSISLAFAAFCIFEASASSDVGKEFHGLQLHSFSPANVSSDATLLQQDGELEKRARRRNRNRKRPTRPRTTRTSTSTSARVSTATKTTTSSKITKTTSTTSSLAPVKTPTKGNSQKFTGQATYYDVEDSIGACGKRNKQTEYVAAASKLMYDTFEGGAANPNNNPICGRKVQATYKGKTITVTIVDRCEGCARGDLDFSPTAFQRFAPLVEGRLNGLTWNFI